MIEGQPEQPNPADPAPGSTDENDPHSPDFVLGARLDFADPNSSLAPLYLYNVGAVTIVVLALIFVGLTYVPIKHSDVWAHLRFGETIVQDGRLPENEPFAETYADKSAPLVDLYWLDQVGAYLLFDWGRKLGGPSDDQRLGAGCVLLSTAFAGIVALRLGLLLVAFRRLCGSTASALVGVLLAVLMSMFVHLLILRPQVVGELAFAALLVPLSRPVLSWRAVVLMPAVIALWANCHGSFPIGLVLIGIFLAGQAVSGGLAALKLKQQGQMREFIFRDPQIRRQTITLILSISAAAFLNPYGPRLLQAVWQLSDNPNIASMNEWQPLPLWELQGWVFLGSLVLLAFLILLAVLGKTSVRFTPTQILLLLVFGIQSVMHARGLVWWTMILPWVVVPHIHALFERAVPTLIRPTQPPNLKKTILTAMLVVVLLMWSPPIIWAISREAPGGLRKVSRETPLQADRYLREQYEADTDGKLSRSIFTSETVGDYLLWDLRLNPPVKITCYTHVHLLPTDHWQRCLIVKEGRPGWQEELDRWEVQFLVIEPAINPGLARRIRESPERWVVVPNMEPLLLARRKGALPH